MSDEETQVRADCAPPAGKIAIIYVKTVRWNYYLIADAAAHTDQIHLQSVSFLMVGSQFTIEQGGTTEVVTITAVDQATHVLTVTGTDPNGKLANAFTMAGKAALIFPLAGLSGSPIYLYDHGTEDNIFNTMAHEIGHTTGNFLDSDSDGSVMYYTEGDGNKLRNRKMPTHYEVPPQTESQWDKVAR